MGSDGCSGADAVEINSWRFSSTAPLAENAGTLGAGPEMTGAGREMTGAGPEMTGVGPEMIGAVSVGSLEG